MSSHGALPVETVLLLVAAVAEALQVIHGAGSPTCPACRRGWSSSSPVASPRAPQARPSTVAEVIAPVPVRNDATALRAPDPGRGCSGPSR
ncbi:hypothetical protein ACFVGY_04195 [Streptomyces sp. NPDC127106]|uniref:hypothetical protein n=1 Tax=Streptomyces sp. NPDC127106 TaxID=3345360 RepID=UPI0036307A6C